MYLLDALKRSLAQSTMYKYEDVVQIKIKELKDQQNVPICLIAGFQDQLKYQYIIKNNQLGCRLFSCTFCWDTNVRVTTIGLPVTSLNFSLI